MLARLAPVLALWLVAASCGSDSAVQPDPVAAPDSVGVSTTARGAEPAPATSSGPVDTTTTVPPDLTVFVAAVDTMLADTSYDGAALTDPEVFIATGQLFCEMLEEGVTEDQILGEHLDALADAKGEAASNEEAVAAGAILGASIQIICPAHARN